MTKKKNTKTSYQLSLTEFSYPYKVKYYQFKSQRQNMKMAYGDLNSQSKLVVVLLHGKNFMGFYWKQAADFLVKKGYRVIIPDQIGFGKSTKPNNYQYNFSQMSLNTMSLLNDLNIEKFKVMGHSMGGMLAVKLAHQNPRVSELVLLNPIGLEDYTKYVHFKDPQFFYEKELAKTKEKIISYQKKHYYDGQWRAEYESLIEPHVGWINGPDWPRIAWNNALLYAPIFSEEIISDFKTIEKKVHLILGTRDRTAPGQSWQVKHFKHKMGQYQKLGKVVQKSNKKYIKLYELNGVGHMPHIEDFQKLSDVLDIIL